MMRNLTTLFSLCFVLGSQAISGTISGNIKGTLSKSNSPYTVVGDITVASGDSLLIEPGVDLLFNNATSFVINGKLSAIGTDSDSIHFLSGKAQPSTGDWNGIFFNGGSTGSLAYAIVENAAMGITANNASPTISYCTVSHNNNGMGCLNGAGPIIEDCRIENNLNAAIRAIGSHPLIRRNQIHRNGLFGFEAAIVIETADAKVFLNYITNNGNGGIDIVTSDSAQIVQNTISMNDMGVTITDSSPEIINNIIAVNNSGIWVDNSNPVITYNDVWSNSGGDFNNTPAGIGDLTVINTRGDSVDNWQNLRIDPQFFNILSGDFRIQIGSPCIDTGDPTNPASHVIIGAGPDRGAYENNGLIVPVELVSLQFRDGVLYWTTATEKNNYGFFIERSYQRETGFSAMGFVPGQGTATTTNAYTYRLAPDSRDAYYRLRQVDFDGNATYSPIISVVGVPQAISLFQNYPNPFRVTLPEAGTTISFTLAHPAHVSLAVFDLNGRVVQVLLRGEKSPGNFSLRWDGTNAQGVPVAAGTYFCRLHAGEHDLTRPMQIIR